ncbi:MAG TPA: cytochrome c-type biogenesis CcmF C-terminal domain-containing protein, partial [Flexilinea sp.]|nr:cytochrome c-type biogenesis CcmF C-terminal domain-containing protein [Flexilinea sp.]
FQNGKNITTVYPKQKYYETSQQMTTIPGIKSDLKDDLYLILTDSETSAEKQEVAVTIFYNPLINWLWIGGILLCLGGILAYATSLRKEKTSS